jgi:hypothetical protein
MSNLLTSQFWLNQTPDLLIPAMEYLLLGLIFFFLIASIACFVLKNRGGFYALLWKKLLNFFVFNAIVGAILFFFNQETVPFLSARIWFIFWAIGLIVWGIFIVVYAQQLPAKKKSMDKEKEYKKYLP